ncbi:hypothetical protein [Aurantibacillus circumpalustris]|uniref:hypothetical protein n=1 Tax=Aurantibacillus circumpalustris TaxID=3036359 RepID=UPI00295B1655|nr:hypothetical protein [Aurantibacillus circumpalustris]
MKQTFYFLHGEDAVAEYNENGVDGCKNKGYNFISKINYSVNESQEIFIKKILDAISGSLETCLISVEDYFTLEK